MEVKFQTLDNFEGVNTLKQHIFKAKECKAQWTGEPYAGNVSLCGKIWCSEDGEYAQDFAEMDNEPFNDENICRTCFRIYTLSKQN